MMTKLTDTDELRARSEELAETARHQAEIARLRAEELAAVGRQRAAQASEQARERASEVADNVGPLLGRLLALITALFGGLGERGRELASRVEPPASVRRRRRLTTAGWFAGGFLAGAATGWVLHARMQERPQEAGTLYGEGDGLARENSPYGTAAAPIDARQDNPSTIR